MNEIILECFNCKKSYFYQMEAEKVSDGKTYKVLECISCGQTYIFTEKARSIFEKNKE